MTLLNGIYIITHHTAYHITPSNPIELPANWFASNCNQMVFSFYHFISGIAVRLFLILSLYLWKSKSAADDSKLAVLGCNRSVSINRSVIGRLQVLWI